jgi:preprotein translocase subunit SecA
MQTRLNKATEDAYAARVTKNGPDLMRYIEKQIVLQTLDTLWREHLVTLDHLRQVIGWRGLAQRDPLNEYKSEAFELFGELVTHLREATISQLSRVEVIDPNGPSNLVAANPAIETSYFESHPEPQNQTFDPALLFNIAPHLSLAPSIATNLGEAATETLPRNEKDPISWGRVGRNEPCPCGSGKKYKHCHGAIG